MYNGIFIDLIGWLGAILGLYAYLMISTNRLKGDSLKYQLFNITSACCLILNTSYHGAMPSMVVNIVWVAIGLYSLYRAQRFAGLWIKRKRVAI